ncbi:hypothetical protein NSQ62_07650 [Solibacillus sp. FSL H8-0523]|uniref:hypothetical protein n=1 Tax=Solibacillus sp. FSL H8-0523 TaxID=2954511 RepID=UPI003100E567
MTNNNSQKDLDSNVARRLDEIWQFAAVERQDIFKNIKNKSEIPFGFKLVGKIAEPMKKKSKKINADRLNSHWEIWRNDFTTILIFRVDNDDYELLALRDMGLTHMFESTEILKATMKLFRMFN